MLINSQGCWYVSQATLRAKQTRSLQKQQLHLHLAICNCRWSCRRVPLCLWLPGEILARFRGLFVWTHGRCQGLSYKSQLILTTRPSHTCLAKADYEVYIYIYILISKKNYWILLLIYKFIVFDQVEKHTRSTHAHLNILTCFRKIFGMTFHILE